MRAAARRRSLLEVLARFCMPFARWRAALADRGACSHCLETSSKPVHWIGLVYRDGKQQMLDYDAQRRNLCVELLHHSRVLALASALRFEEVELHLPRARFFS